MAEYHLGVNLTAIEKQRKSKFKYELAIFLSVPLFIQGTSCECKPPIPFTWALTPEAVAPLAIQIATTTILWPFKPLIQWYLPPIYSRAIRVYNAVHFVGIIGGRMVSA